MNRRVYLVIPVSHDSFHVKIRFSFFFLKFFLFFLLIFILFYFLSKGEIARAEGNYEETGKLMRWRHMTWKTQRINKNKVKKQLRQQQNNVWSDVCVKTNLPQCVSFLRKLIFLSESCLSQDKGSKLVWLQASHPVNARSWWGLFLKKFMKLHLSTEGQVPRQSHAVEWDWRQEDGGFFYAQ